VRRLGRGVPAGAGRSRTARLRLRGAAGLEELASPGAAGAFGLDEERWAALLERHGGEAPEVLALARGRPELLEPLVPGLPQLKVEALWAARQEMALTLDDVLSRRTRARLRRALDSARCARGLAELLASEWGRPPEALGAEADALSAQIGRDLERAGVAGAGTETGAGAGGLAERGSAAARGRAGPP
jgi:glycerol-3-phosphate dehydrogenase